jgi:hypothetical protein
MMEDPSEDVQQLGLAVLVKADLLAQRKDQNHGTEHVSLHHVNA